MPRGAVPWRVLGLTVPLRGAPGALKLSIGVPVGVGGVPLANVEVSPVTIGAVPVGVGKVPLVNVAVSPVTIGAVPTGVLGLTVPLRGAPGALKLPVGVPVGDGNVPLA